MFPVVIAIVIVLFLAFDVLIFLAIRQARSRTIRGAKKVEIQRAWDTVEQMEDPYRQVMEADKVLDQALGVLGYSGSLGEKLKVAGPRFSDLDGLWAAHKLRNRLAHETGMEVSDEQAMNALRVFRRALTDVGVF